MNRENLELMILEALERQRRGCFAAEWVYLDRSYRRGFFGYFDEDDEGRVTGFVELNRDNASFDAYTFEDGRGVRCFLGTLCIA